MMISCLYLTAGDESNVGARNLPAILQATIHLLTFAFRDLLLLPPQVVDLS
jgi:hypothetical protein